MQRDARKYLFDISDSCQAVVDYTRDVTFNEYANDRRIRSAVEREFIIIGEALNQLRRLDAAYEDRLPEIHQIINFRHVLVHGYDVVQHEVVWQIIQAAVVPLKTCVDTLLTDLADG